MKVIFKISIATLALATATLALATGTARGQEPPPSPEETATAIPDVGTSADYQTIITATRSEEPIADTPIATEIITRETIESSGAENLAEILDEHPGVDVVRSFAGASVHLQGLDPEYVLVLIDGQRVIGRTNGAIDLSRIPADHIERIEIVRGASSALYGSDAIGGVINIITRRARRSLEAEASVAYGSFDAVDLRGHAGYRRGIWNVSMTAGWHRSDAIDLDPSEPSTTASAFDEVQVGGRLQAQPSATSKVVTAAEYLQRRQHGIDASPSGAVFDRENLTETVSVRSSGSFKPTSATRLTLTGQYAFFRDQFLSDQRLSDALDEYQETREQLAEACAQLELHLPGDHFLTAGGEGLFERLASDRLDGGEGSRRRGAAYLQDEWLAMDAPRLVIVPALRLDGDSQFGSHVSPKLAVRWDPHDTVVLRASYGWGFRAPSFKELLLRFENPAAGYVVEGNPDLEPESSRNLDLGAEWRPRPWVWVSINLFRNDIDDLIATSTVDDAGAGGPLRFTYANVSAAYTQGVESVLRVRVGGGVTLQIGYTLTDSEDQESGLALEGRALHRGTFEAAYRHAAWGVDASLRGAVVGERPFYVDRDGDGSSETETSDPYATIDARIAKHFGSAFTLFAGVDNLLDAGDAVFVPLPPRTFYGGAVARYH